MTNYRHATIEQRLCAGPVECPRCRVCQRDSRTLLRAVRNIKHLIEVDLVFPLAGC